MIFQLKSLQMLNSNDSVVPGNSTSSPRESDLTHTAVTVLLFVVLRVKCLHTVVHTGRASIILSAYSCRLSQVTMGGVHSETHTYRLELGLMMVMMACLFDMC